MEPGRRPQRCRCNVPTNTTLAEGTGFEGAMAQVEAAGGLILPWLAAGAGSLSCTASCLP